MDDHTLRNWHGYYQPPRNRSSPTKPLFNNQHELGRNHHQTMVNIHYNNGGVYYPHRVDMVGLHDPQMSPDSIPVDDWLNQQRDVKVNMNLAYGGPFEASGSQGLQILQQHETLEKESMVGTEEPQVNGNGTLKKRRPGGGRAKKSPNDDCIPAQRASKPARKSMGVNMNGVDIDISGIPIPVCSCTGAPQQCYRWGCGGWQSACCTTSISMYPLPMSDKRRGARTAGRKMSQGAFKKVLEKLASEGYNLYNPIDLRNHWAKHGTNRFVTIR